MKKRYFTLFEILLWSISVIILILSFLIFSNNQYHYLIGSIIGVTALIFLAKGNPIGQALTILFAIFYGVISYSYKYYGEMITYLFMSAPTALIALITWIKNPFGNNKYEVKINEISKKEWIFASFLTIFVTIAFYFILKAFNTNNLIVSTISVTTSFIASYLAARRSRFYAICYSFNDIVLIILWGFACINDISYIPMVICFISFLVNDIYGFISWTKSMKRQKM